MSSALSVQPSHAVAQPAIGGGATTSGELAKCETQLSDWVHCPSSKTPTGKAKIAEITGRIDAIKAEMKRTEEEKDVAAAVQSQSVNAGPPLRFDGTGVWVNLQA